MKRGMLPFPRRRDGARSARLRAGVAAALVLATLLVGLDTLAWFRLERSLDRRLDRFALAARAAGWRFSAQAGERGGWPLAASLTLLRPSLRGTGSPLPGDIAWSGDAVTLDLSPLHPGHATVLAQGTQSLSIAGESRMRLLLRFWGSRIALQLPADRQAPASGALRLDADALHVAAPGAGPDDIALVAGLTARLRWQTAPGAAGVAPDTAALSLLLRDVALPARLGAGGDRVLQKARLEARLVGRIPQQAMPLIDALDQWRQSGGRLRIEEASVDWGRAAAAAGGEAALGADGTANGRFDLTVTDADEILRQLRDAGLIDPATMLAAGAVIGLIAAGQDGPRVHLPLQLRDGTLRLGEIPLLRTGTLLPPAADAR